MYYTLRNDTLCLTINTLGAEIVSLKSADGVEYLWQGDPKYWGDRAPHLFPFIGRLTNNSYQHLGKVYPMNIHGFAAAMEFTLVEQTENTITLELTETPSITYRSPFVQSIIICWICPFRKTSLYPRNCV